MLEKKKKKNVSRINRMPEITERNSAVEPVCHFKCIGFSCKRKANLYLEIAVFKPQLCLDTTYCQRDLRRDHVFILLEGRLPLFLFNKMLIPL